MLTPKSYCASVARAYLLILLHFVTGKKTQPLTNVPKRCNRKFSGIFPLYCCLVDRLKYIILSYHIIYFILTR